MRQCWDQQGDSAKCFSQNRSIIFHENQTVCLFCFFAMVMLFNIPVKWLQFCKKCIEWKFAILGHFSVQNAICLIETQGKNHVDLFIHLFIWLYYFPLFGTLWRSLIAGNEKWPLVDFFYELQPDAENGSTCSSSWSPTFATPPFDYKKTFYLTDS